MNCVLLSAHPIMHASCPVFATGFSLQTLVVLIASWVSLADLRADATSGPSAPDAATSATTGDQKTIALPYPEVDPDGDAVTLTGVTPDAHITINSTFGNSVTFTTASDFVGTAGFTYTVSDGFGGTATGNVVVSVTDNDPPTISPTGVGYGTLEFFTKSGTKIALPNYAAQAQATDALGAVSTIKQVPVAGTMVGPATTLVTLSATDSAGNVGRAYLTVRVSTGQVPRGSYFAILTQGALPKAALHLRALSDVISGTLRLASGARLRVPPTRLSSSKSATITLKDGSTLTLAFRVSGGFDATHTGIGGTVTGVGELAQARPVPGAPGIYPIVAFGPSGETGWLRVAISNRGLVRVMGRMPNGTSVASGQQSPIMADGLLGLFVLSGGKTPSLFTGDLRFETQAESDVTGDLTWTNGETQTAFSARGAKYVPGSLPLLPGAYGISITNFAQFKGTPLVFNAPATALKSLPLVNLKPYPRQGIFTATLQNVDGAGLPIGPILKSAGVFNQKLQQGIGQVTVGSVIERITIAAPVAPPPEPPHKFAQPQ